MSRYAENYEFHQSHRASMTDSKKNYEIFQKTLDKRPRHDIKLFHSAKSAAWVTRPGHERSTEPNGKRNIADARNPKRETASKQHDVHLRKTLPTLPRRHPVRHQTRRTDPKVSAVHAKHRPSSGSRTALAKIRATSSLTTGAIASGEYNQNNSQLKPRSRIGAFWLPT